MHLPYPPVDVLLVCYQQERYVAEAVRSILAQTYPGQLRVTVLDDASTDKTVERIEAVAGERADIPFKFVPSERNLGYPGNYKRAFASCQEQYVAILEGDDYWCDAGKLKKQVEFLESNPDCVMCGCNSFLRFEETGESSLVNHVVTGISKIDAEGEAREILISNFSTSVYQRQALEALPPALFDSSFGDWIVNICVGLEGCLGFLHEPLSVHRIHSEALWGGLSNVGMAKKLFDLIHDYDLITDGRFREVFAHRREVLAEFVDEERRKGVFARPEELSREPKSKVVGFDKPPEQRAEVVVVQQGSLLQLQNRLEDCERRHANLLTEYRTLAAGYENLVAEYQKLEGVHQSLLAEYRKLEARENTGAGTQLGIRGLLSRMLRLRPASAGPRVPRP